MVTDPIADMMIQIKNAGMAGRASVTLPASELKLAIAEKLKQAGFIQHITKRGKKIKKFLELEVAYKKPGAPALNEVYRVSKPSRRVYQGYKEIRSVRQGYGVALYSTPKGILTDKEARQEKVGGEILFKVW